MLKFFTRLGCLLIILGCGISWEGCNVINPSETVPTYIHIDTFAFDATPPNPNQRVSLSHDITSVTAYYNGESIGTFDLPANIPVMVASQGSLRLAPGITIDGRNSITGAYPFYRLDTSTIVAQPGKVINYIPKTGYFKDMVPYMISDFESGLTNFGMAGGNVGMTLVTADSLVYEGAASGGIFMSNAGDSSVDSAITSFPIPFTAAFIELNYNSTVPFYVGLQAKLGSSVSSTPYYLIGLYPSTGWKKLYLNVSDFNGTYQGTSYNLYIKATLPDGQSSGRLLLDNIQLITF